MLKNDLSEEAAGSAKQESPSAAEAAPVQPEPAPATRVAPPNERKAKAVINAKKKTKVEMEDLYRRGRKRDLTRGQVDYTVGEIQKAILSGVRPVMCSNCKRLEGYGYCEYEKRGGDKTLYCCLHCLYRWSTFSCAEEDYDFLSC